MRTTYVSKTSQNSVQQEVQGNGVKPESVKLSETYIELKDNCNRAEETSFSEIQSNLQMVTNQTEAEAVQSYKSNENKARVNQPKQPVKQQAKQSPQNKKQGEKKKRNPVIIFAAAFSVVLLFGLGFILYYNSPSPRELENKISKLYTSTDKLDIKEGISQKDLDSYYSSVYSLKKKGKSVDSIESELDTIGYFIQDMSKLKSYEDTSFDLSISGLTTKLQAIKDNTKSYTVPGLAVTISDEVSSLLTQYDNFVSLKLELQSITDVISFDEAKYTALINNIKHEPNNAELQGIYDTIVADKRAAEAQAKIEAAQSEAEKLAAEKALAEAQKLQQSTQEELKQLQKSLEEALKSKASELSTEPAVKSDAKSLESSSATSETVNSIK